MPSATTIANGPLGRLIVLDEITRGGLAERLHDGPVQDLLATRYLVDLALSAAAKGADAESLALRLQAIRDAAAAALSGSRAMLGELTARATDGRNLAGAVKAGSPAALTGDENDAELPPVPAPVAVLTHRLARALTAAAPDGAPIRVTQVGDALAVTLEASVDLFAPGLREWVERAELLGAAAECSDGVTTVVFDLTTASEGP